MIEINTQWVEDAPRWLKEPLALGASSAVFRLGAVYFRSTCICPHFREIAVTGHYVLALAAISWTAALLCSNAIRPRLNDRVSGCLDACLEELAILGGFVGLTRGAEFYLHIIEAPSYAMQTIEGVHIGSVIVVTVWGATFLLREAIPEDDRQQMLDYLERMRSRAWGRTEVDREQSEDAPEYPANSSDDD